MLKIIVTLGIFLISYPATASVVTEYAVNSYNDHVLSRAEKKCIDEGYSTTYASCANQTAPADRCPHHDGYYRSCSQEQWCRNNNYTFLAKDCELPTYPLKICDNQFPIYRVCQKDVEKACKSLGYSHISECSLSDQRCEYDNDYGKCCDECPDYPYELNNIPAGYISSNELCTTCEGVVKTKVKENPCEGFTACAYGPMSKQTPSCQQGNKTLYSACKTAETVCREEGYNQTSCADEEDEIPCPHQESIKKCKINCSKFAKIKFSESDIISQDVTNPDLDMEKNSLRSMYGEISPECISNNIPIITLNINKDTFPVYRTLFTKNITNVNFVINFEEPFSLESGGHLDNVRIKVNGTPGECFLSGNNLHITNKVSLSGSGDICSNIQIDSMSKLTVSGNIVGNVTMDSNASLGVKGNLVGALNTKSFPEVFIKGQLIYKNKQANTLEHEGIVFGCNTRAKIVEGITAEAANIFIKQYSLIDTPYINIISQGASDSGSASIHLYKYTKITSIIDESEYQITDNSETSGPNSCDDKYIIHTSSAISDENGTLSLNTADSLKDKWQCRQLTRPQMKCN